MPFQVYWGALFARLGGPLHFHSSLRLSTLVLWALALVAFYLLCREHGLERELAGLLTLGLFSSPLTLKVSFSFMTDVPYLSCFLIALYCFTRAWRLQRYYLMFAASLVASAAILVRQFGVVIIAGVILVWVITPNHARHSRLALTGLALPLMAFGWQLYRGLKTPTWATQYNFYMLKLYYSQALGLLHALLWRPAVILEYVAFFALPFALLPVLLQRRKSEHGHIPQWLPPALIAACIVVILFVSRALEPTRMLMPLLPWHFEPLLALGHAPRLLLTTLTTLGGGVAGFCFLSRYRSDWPSLSSEQRLLDFVTAGVALILLTFWMIGDEYLLPLLPYALIVPGLRCSPFLQRHARVVTACCLIIGFTSAIYTRQLLAASEAFWKAGEIARSSAASSATISSSWPWTSYHYFDQFLAGNRKNVYLPSYFDWLDRRARSADYLVSETLPADSSRTVVATVKYRPFPFIVRHVYVLAKRVPE